MCDANCVLVEKFIVDKSSQYNYSRNAVMDKYHCMLMNYKCYREANTGAYGHMNYAIISYAVTNNHLECLKTLHKNGAMWHADLACVAVENNNIECLVYIMSNMGNVECGEKLLKYAKSDDVQDYIIKKCWNCQDGILHPKIKY